MGSQKDSGSGLSLVVTGQTAPKDNKTGDKAVMVCGILLTFLSQCCLVMATIQRNFLPRLRRSQAQSRGAGHSANHLRGVCPQLGPFLKEMPQSGSPSRGGGRGRGKERQLLVERGTPCDLSGRRPLRLLTTSSFQGCLSLVCGRGA